MALTASTPLRKDTGVLLGWLVNNSIYIYTHRPWHLPPVLHWERTQECYLDDWLTTLYIYIYTHRPWHLPPVLHWGRTQECYLDDWLTTLHIYIYTHRPWHLPPVLHWGRTQECYLDDWLTTLYIYIYTYSMALTASTPLRKDTGVLLGWLVNNSIYIYIYIHIGHGTYRQYSTEKGHRSVTWMTG